jgi:SAM-dependent methyltransferase
VNTRFDETAARYEKSIERALGPVSGALDSFTRAKVDCLLALAQRRLGEPRNVCALDVGCGVGLTDSMLEPHLGQLHGVDVSNESVRLARERNPTVEYQSYDGSRLPYEDRAFDMSFAICVLHHVAPDRWLDLVCELGRVTKPSGLVVTIEHNKLNPMTQLVVSRCEFDEDAVLLSRRETVQLFARAGLSDIESRYILFSPYRRRWVERIEARLATIPLGSQFVVAASAR